MLKNNLRRIHPPSKAFEAAYSDKIKARVQVGAAHLDEVVPDWFHRINLRELDMRDYYHWVSAQVAGSNYGNAYNELRLYMMRVGVLDAGFICERSAGDKMGFQYYTIAQDHWLAEIRKRLDSSAGKHDPEQVTQTEEV